MEEVQTQQYPHQFQSHVAVHSSQTPYPSPGSSHSHGSAPSSVRTVQEAAPAHYDPQWHGHRRAPPPPTELFAYDTEDYGRYDHLLQFDRHHHQHHQHRHPPQAHYSPHQRHEALPKQQQHQAPSASGLVYSAYDPSSVYAPTKGQHGRAAPPPPLILDHHPNLQPHLAVIKATGHPANGATHMITPPTSARSLPGDRVDSWKLPHHVFPEIVPPRPSRSDSWPGSIAQLHQLPTYELGADNASLASYPAPTAHHSAHAQTESSSAEWRRNSDGPTQSYADPWSSQSQQVQQQRPYPPPLAELFASASHSLSDWNAGASTSQLPPDHGTAAEPNLHDVASARTKPGGDQSQSCAWWALEGQSTGAWNGLNLVPPVTLGSNGQEAADFSGTGSDDGAPRSTPAPRTKTKAKSRSRNPKSEHSNRVEEQHIEGSASPVDDDKSQSSRRKTGELSRDFAQRRYRCDLCVGEPRMFARPSALKIHMLTHTKLKPHVCPECRRCFSIPSNLTRHRKLHMLQAHKRADEDEASDGEHVVLEEPERSFINEELPLSFRSDEAFDQPYAR